ncbi:MAG TPA: asparagine synthase (glutamine-hydrolyzing) [Candidatus Krumholzibacteria bacterium]|nr:asparagine synthase (glutamine-hydrolyzing) [Candidatus Krumholzibacteria bacterium]
MCGIVGVVALTERGQSWLDRLDAATERLALRGPDHGAVCRDRNVGLGHRRLAVIDTSSAANQPMNDDSGRYTIVYNGEIYNFRELRDALVASGRTPRTHSDSEVVLSLFADEGPSMLQKLNGFFAFAIYDRHERSLFLARDRLGIKPLLTYQDDDVLIFASELKAILSFPIRRELDDVSLFQYLQLSYVPAPHSMLKGVRKLEPGCTLTVREGAVRVERYYAVPTPTEKAALAYEDAQRRLSQVLDAAVAKQLVADVPLGAFLSGGLDSTVVAALAARHKPDLETYAIGFPDQPLYDESADAAAAAKALGVRHTTFPVTDDELYGHLFDVLDYTDEPFSDSSALAVYILSRHTRRHVTVALSGDGADELFGGYNKHYAEALARRSRVRATLVRAASPLWRSLPRSRETAFADAVRRLDRFARRAGLSPAERYWSWCSFTDQADVLRTLGGRFQDLAASREYAARKGECTRWIDGRGINDVLYSDVALVLPNDMLKKVDAMSMANGLEVRVPFLDHEVVEYAFSLPSHFKIDGGARKRILRDAFRGTLPAAVLRKRKHGFEVPLMRWFRSHLCTLIRDDLLNRRFVEQQGIFDANEIDALVARLYSERPGDIAAQVWSLVVFQYWWKKVMV